MNFKCLPRLLVCLSVVLIILLISSFSYSFQYKGMNIEVLGTISEMYDDNLTFTKDDKKRDFTTAIGLGLAVKYEGKRNYLDFTTQLNQGFNARFRDIKSSSQSLSLNFQNELSQYDRITLSDTFSHSQFSESFEEEFGRVKHRRESYNNSLNLNYIHNISEHLDMNASYSYSESLFPDELKRRYFLVNLLLPPGLDNVSNPSQYRLGFNVSYSPDLTFGYSLSFNYAKNNFGDAIYDAGINITKRIYISKKSFFTGGLGFSGSEINNIHINIIASFTNEEKIDESTFTNITFNTSEQLSSEEEGVFRSWKINGQISREISRRLNGSLSVFYGQGTFSSIDITNTLLGANIALSYLIHENFNGNLSYSYSNLDSTDGTGGYTRNTITLAISKTF